MQDNSDVILHVRIRPVVLMSRPSVACALQGCLILIQVDRIPLSAMCSISDAFLKEIEVQQLKQADRASSLQLLLELLQVNVNESVSPCSNIYFKI